MSKEIKDSELFIGSNIRVISRSDRNVGEHGGVLIAAQSNLPPIFDLSNEQYPFTVACALVTFASVSFYILLCQPPSSSSYRVPATLVHESIAEYQSIFTTFCQKHNLNSNFNLFVLGDFNMPDVDWSISHSPHSTDNVILNTLFDSGLQQMIDVPTHNDGNTLDLIFCNLENLSFTVSHPRFSDHHPVIFQAQHSICNEAASFGES